MSDMSDEEQTVEIPYSSRPEWADIKPIDQDNETNNIVRIAYTESFKDVFGYFRAILNLNEKSERAFELTTDAALLNPANYTVWYYRRILLKELGKDLYAELNFMNSVISDHPKNYQVWQHRRNVVEWLHDPSGELLFTKHILEKDSKNYHAWQYRQWVVKTFRLWSTELEYIEQLLEADVRNNSAWNQRYFYFINQGVSLDSHLSIGTIENELTYCIAQIEKCMDNESVWNYMRAFVKHLRQATRGNDQESVYDKWLERIVDLCKRNVIEPREENRSAFAMSFLIDANIEQVAFIVAKDDQTSILDSSDKLARVRQLLDSSFELLDQLANKYDAIRKNYWNYLTFEYKQLYKIFLQ